MDTVVGIACLVAIVCAALYGVYHEIKVMKAARLKEQKQTELYELLIQKIDFFCVDEASRRF